MKPMRRQALPRFRRDLDITPSPQPGGRRSYIIRNTATNERFEFGEEDYFICQSLDGRSTEAEVIDNAQRFLGVKVSAEYIEKLITQLRDLGLLEHGYVPPEPGAPEDGSAEEPRSGEDAEDESDDLGSRRSYRWSLFNPDRLLARVAAFCARNVWLFKAFLYLLLPVVAVTSFLLVQRWQVFLDDVQRFPHSSYIASLVFGLLTCNLFVTVVNAVQLKHFGAAVKEFGVRLRYYVILRFFCDKRDLKRLDPAPRMWVYLGTLAVRFTVLSSGVILWHLSRDGGTSLPFWGITLIQSGLFAMMVSFLPDRAAHGYKLLLTYFKLPADWITRSMLVFTLTVTRRPLPTSFSRAQRWRLFAWALVLFAFWGLFAYTIVSTATNGWNSMFPGVFGKATPAIIGAGVFIMFLRWFVPTVREVFPKGLGPRSGAAAAGKEPLPAWLRNSIIALLLLAALWLPFPLHLGGNVQLLPPRQQQLTAPVAGRIAEVLYEGGDGAYLAAGTVVARMSSDLLENQVRLLTQEIQRQQAVIDGSKAGHDLLLSGSRPEEIRAAAAQVEALREKVEGARFEVQSAEIAVQYSASQLQVLEELFRQGAYPRLELENARRQAETAVVNKEVARKTLDAAQSLLRQAEAQYDLVKGGARVEEIEAAHQQVESARAELRRLEEELSYAKDQISRTTLTMPMAGYLASGYLGQKVGQYLQPGESFALVQDDRKLLVQLELPEFDAAEIAVGSKAVVRLLALPTRSIPGQVVSVEPVPAESVEGRFFRIQIEIENPGLTYRPGMSGYGKIVSDKRPIGLILSRPIVRFFRVEFWSWLP